MRSRAKAEGTGRCVWKERLVGNLVRTFLPDQLLGIHCSTGEMLSSMTVDVINIINLSMVGLQRHRVEIEVSWRAAMDYFEFFAPR
ncbi:hypothetical protein JOQ06_024905, partial [Pogonophryne albipinna]